MLLISRGFDSSELSFGPAIVCNEMCVANGIILLLQFGVVFSALSPITKCSLSDSNCIQTSAQQMSQIFIAGFPELGTETLDPMKVDAIKVDLSGLKLDIRDVIIKGLNNSVIENMRYILDNGNIVKNRRVLDVGCGCGASSIAAVKMKAKCVVANDIDPCATTATEINADFNKVKVKVSTNDFIGLKCDDFDTILIGDMFYDAEFARMLFDWLQKLTDDGKTVLLGDPGRHGLTDSMRQHISLLAKYNLPKESCIENHGFTDATVWRINPTTRCSSKS